MTPRTTRTRRTSSHPPVPLTVWPYLPAQPGSLADRNAIPLGDRPAAHVINRLIATFTQTDQLIIDLDNHPGTAASANWLHRRATLVTVTDSEHGSGWSDTLLTPLLPRHGEPATYRTLASARLVGALLRTAGCAALIISRYPRVDASGAAGISTDLLVRACAEALAQHGVLVLTPDPVDADGRFADHVSHAIHVARRAGLTYHQHIIAVQEPLRSDAETGPLHRPFRPDRHRDTRPVHRRAHIDLLVFVRKVAINV